MRSIGFDRIFKMLQQILRGLDSHAPHAEAASYVSPSYFRRGQLGQGPGVVPGIGIARACSLDLQNSVSVVGAQDGRDVKPFARLRPQSLDRVHPAAVGLKRYHAAVRARDRGAGRPRESLSDPTPAPADPGVRSKPKAFPTP